MAEESVNPIGPPRESPGRGERPTGTPFERVLRQAMHQRQVDASFTNRVLRPLAERMTEPHSILMRNVNLDEIRMRLMRAGFPYGLRARDYVFVRWVSVLLFTLLFMAVIPLVAVAFEYTGPLVYMASIVVGIWLGYRLPDMWIAMQIRKRQQAIQLELPDTIDLITISVEAGLGLYAAMQRVGQRFPGPLSDELLRSLQEVRLGRSHVDALRDLSRRVDVPDLTAFISSLLQAELLGIAIANVLRVQSERLREKRRQRAREQAQKAPLKMLFPLVFFIFPALFVVILGPALLRVLNSGY